MQSRADWLAWAQTLRRFKLDGLALWLLEAGSPLALLGAQMLYAVQPLLGETQIRSLAQMLENEQETKTFVQYLRGEAAQ
ncbi:MAG: hypothetical protein ACOYYF_11205 [Chloroflexota bacterium]|nr:hypothetical protein [Chloroflexota bacterium]MBI5702472.1 hypothetical protein [Chloroflexota bacterium]